MNLPRNHVASVSQQFDAPPSAVYAAIRDFASYAKWRKGVKRVELLDATHFREHSRHGAITFAVLEDIPDTKLVTQIADKDLGFGGMWTYEIAPQDGGTMLRITENGEISNLLFRFLTRYVLGYTATMDAYVKALRNYIR